MLEALLYGLIFGPSILKCHSHLTFQCKGLKIHFNTRNLTPYFNFKSYFFQIHNVAHLSPACLARLLQKYLCSVTYFKREHNYVIHMNTNNIFQKVNRIRETKQLTHYSSSRFSCTSQVVTIKSFNDCSLISVFSFSL